MASGLLLQPRAPGVLHVAGVLSGTSADGISVGLVRLPFTRRALGLELGSPELARHEVVPFERELAARVRAVLDGAPCGLRESALLSRDLGLAFGHAARDVALRARFDIDLVGSHGQTVWHHDGGDGAGRATSQLGDGDFIAEAASCAVASDFRQRDIAAGGEGAPLSALADGLIFARAPRPCAVLNLGGMGNLTWLGEDEREVLAFDTGPANSLLDGLARSLLGADCDRDGAVATRGSQDETFVAWILEHPFFARRPPKSTGRDTFGRAWVEGVVARAQALRLLETGPQNLFASATHAVAQSVALALERWCGGAARELLLAGGGVHNRALVAALARRTGIPVRSSAAVGVDPDAREALVFAVLGARLALGLPSTQSAVTGAGAGRVLGKWSPAHE